MTRAAAVVFDFDGVILETTACSHQSWSELYEEYGLTFPLARWQTAIGTRGGFDTFAHLQSLIVEQLDREDVLARRQARLFALAETLDVLEGVRDRLDDARRLGLKTAIATSADDRWVLPHLERLGLLGDWDFIACCVDPNRAKPDPEIYLRAVASLDVAPEAAIAIEDSPIGIRAAKRAGLRCVAVPHPFTAELDLSEADLRIDTLAHAPLDELIARLGFHP